MVFTIVSLLRGMCNFILVWAGNSRWVNSMDWSGKEAFVSSSDKPFTVDGKEAGVLKSHGPLSFLKVRYIYYHRVQLSLYDQQSLLVNRSSHTVIGGRGKRYMPIFTIFHGNH